VSVQPITAVVDELFLPLIAAAAGQALAVSPS
jgi:hypothetical protein